MQARHRCLKRGVHCSSKRPEASLIHRSFTSVQQPPSCSKVRFLENTLYQGEATNGSPKIKSRRSSVSDPRQRVTRVRPMRKILVRSTPRFGRSVVLCPWGRGDFFSSDDVENRDDVDHPASPRLYASFDHSGQVMTPSPPASPCCKACGVHQISVSRQKTSGHE